MGTPLDPQSVQEGRQHILADTLDPSVTPVSGPVGAFFIRIGAVPGLYQKQDEGITANWTLVSGDIPAIQAAIAALQLAVGVLQTDVAALEQKSVFFQAETNASFNNYRVRNVGGSGNFRYDFKVPEDFASLVSLQAIFFPTVGASGAGRQFQLTSEYGAIGEAFNQNSASDTVTVDLTGMTNLFYALDISSVFGNLSAGDFAGILIDQLAIGGATNYLGILLRYQS